MTHHDGCSNCQHKNCEKNSKDVYDVLIIGGGAIGCSVARALSQYKLKTVLLEQSSDVSQGASKSNSGIVHGGYDEMHGTVKSQLAYRGNQLFQVLDDQLHFGFRRIGSLVLAFSEQEHQTLLSLMENGIKNGVPGLRILTGKQVLEMEPHVDKSIYSAMHCPHSGICSPYEYTIALAENAQMNGVEILLNQQVDDVQHLEKDLFLVHTQKHVFYTRVVVNCAGLMADRIAGMVGAADFSILPRKGEYIILNKSQGHLAKHVLFPVPDKNLGKGILVSPTFHGNLLLGPTSRDQHDKPMNREQVAAFIIKNAVRFIPDIDPSEAITSYTGNRAKCSRKDFIIEVSKIRGFINVAGIDSPGLTSSPAVAERVVGLCQQELQRHARVMLRNTSFNPTRQAIIKKKDESFKGRIDDPNPSLNIICRCERVTEQEIVDAIHRPVGATDTDAVKRRTRAGMGHCQGTFCEPRVARLLARELKVSVDKIHGHSAGSSILPHRRVTEEDRAYLSSLKSKL